MKTIMIERVYNGWIVRPFSPCENWSTCASDKVQVFTKVEDIQQALPELLGLETLEKKA